MKSLWVEVAGERLQLFAERALYWPRAETLLIADAHLGKASAFSTAGIPVPEQITNRDLARISGLLDDTNAKRLLVLGDLFHARTGQSASTVEAFETWRNRHITLPMILTLGNHDAAIGKLPEPWNIQVVPDFYEAPFYFAHKPEAAARGFGVFGHVHPSMRCAGMRLACFHFSGSAGLLPAFGSFTGTHVVNPRTSDRVYAINAGQIIQVPEILFRR